MIFVTGGTGLIGSHLLYELAREGKKVRALKRPSSNTENAELLFHWYSNGESSNLLSKIEWVDGDIVDIFSLQEALNGVDQIYHAAAVVSFDPRLRENMMHVNIEGTANVVNSALDNGVKKICHVSSIATFGRRKSGEHIDENIQWKSSPNNSNYAISKYGAEREVWRGIAEGLEAVIVNPSMVIGPGRWDISTPKMFTKVWNGLKFYTSGINGFIDARDVARIMIQLMDSTITGERFILTQENYKYSYIFNLIADHLGKPRPSIKAGKFLSELSWRADKLKSAISGKEPLITRETARKANQKYFYSNQKIKEHLDYDFIPIEKTIQDTAEIFCKAMKVGEASR